MNFCMFAFISQNPKRNTQKHVLVTTWPWAEPGMNPPLQCPSSISTERFLSLVKKSFDNANECSNNCTTALISHASKAILKSLQDRLQQYKSWELPDVQAGYRKGGGSRSQEANIHWITEKAREFQKNFSFCFPDFPKSFDCVDHNKLWKILKEMWIPDNLACLLRNLYAGWEAKVRMGHGQNGTWYQIGRWVRQGCILSPCLFNLCAEYIMRSARLDIAQAGIKIAGEISITWDMQVTPPLWQKVKRN